QRNTANYMTWTRSSWMSDCLIMAQALAVLEPNAQFPILRMGILWVTLRQFSGLHVLIFFLTFFTRALELTLSVWMEIGLSIIWSVIPIGDTEFLCIP